MGVANGMLSYTGGLQRHRAGRRVKLYSNIGTVPTSSRRLAGIYAYIHDDMEGRLGLVSWIMVHN